MTHSVYRGCDRLDTRYVFRTEGLRIILIRVPWSPIRMIGTMTRTDNTME